MLILLGFQNEQSYRLNDLLRLGDVKYNERENEKYFQSKKIKEKGTLFSSASFKILRIKSLTMKYEDELCFMIKIY